MAYRLVFTLITSYEYKKSQWSAVVKIEIDAVPRITADRECWNLGARRRYDTNHKSVHKLSRVAFWGGGGHKSTPVKENHMLFPPACSSPTYNWRSAGQLAEPVHENGHPLTKQSVRYHSLSGTISFRFLACYSLLPTRPGYMACKVESLSMLVSGNFMQIQGLYQISSSFQQHLSALDHKVMDNFLPTAHFRSTRCHLESGFYCLHDSNGPPLYSWCSNSACNVSQVAILASLYSYPQQTTDSTLRKRLTSILFTFFHTS